ncbi:MULTISPECIES: bifunctional phosphopantothenoylcysteine decarboxylase/phosphopantothenate--cysteine ligase CoaBC [unclassified Sphingobium]|uniref:bifunctional phosphopantothenoylcysteine decarboxylase/phosphopantothenate--cysteine ligase CoaBC n=1 Tax=unclassified Sphingobium TaxID=2611147 RepID=UPI00222555E5|nr:MULTISPECIES: bifunctional phosphopantothenoylcysteine decarboxylase/phosphopantothenate--cysteine ligase CoaBC [unclassified Sphingobium]MCW2396417.1 phosphopantothenoylcysteine decarboxylase/phosphopantothenate--cysteine ligase [Sphingobium sp. B8D3B]MCW2419933.1 phosphopantothenoylcysteine decarboxylase/phosphopantothenate--cysteine ligase [Sphingobium sp. B8D3C]
MTQRILLIVSGGIAAYKALELVRLLKGKGLAVRAVLTDAATKFVTPLSFGVLSEDHVYGDMFDLKEEREIGHIQLSREADLIVVAPATANILAKMASGIADDLATTVLLATDKPVLAVPAMNVRMWHHKATQRNLDTLRGDGIHVMEPDVGAMACNEWGKGRLPEPAAIVQEIERLLAEAPSPAALLTDTSRTIHAPDLSHANLLGRHVLVTAGPTHEPIDPVRYIANRSSGQQGFAIAAAAAQAGARVTLIAGPVSLPTPRGVTRVDVQTAREMQAAVEGALPADIAILVAAVADWRAADEAGQKIKKDGSGTPAPLALAENPDILATLARHGQRPALLVGFAAETETVVDHAIAKRQRKGADWIVANDVSGDVMGGSRNSVHLVTAQGVEDWPDMPKALVATRLIERISDELAAR